MPKQPKPKPVGRPKLLDGNAKATMLRVRITPEEAKQVEFAAKISNQTVSEWIRSAVSNAYKQALSTTNLEGSHLGKAQTLRRNARAAGLRGGVKG